MKFSDKIKQELDPDHSNLGTELEDNREAITEVAKTVRQNTENLEELKNTLERLEEAIKAIDEKHESNIPDDYIEPDELVDEITERVKNELEDYESTKQEIETGQPSATPAPSEEETGENKASNKEKQKPEEPEESEEVECEICGDTYEDNRGLAGHLRYRHGIKGSGITKKHGKKAIQNQEEQQEEKEEEEEEIELDKTLSEKQEIILKNLQTGFYTPSQEIVEGEEKLEEVQDISYLYPDLNRQGLIDTRRGSGIRLSNKGLKYLQQKGMKQESSDTPIDMQISKTKGEVLVNCKTDEFVSSRDISQVMDISSNAVKDRFRTLPERGVVETRKGSGFRLTEKGKKIKDQLLENTDLEDKISLKEKQEESSSDTEDYELPDGKGLHYDFYNYEERKKAVKQVMQEAKEPLTFAEIARKVFNLEDNIDIDSTKKYYHRVQSVVRKFQQNDEVTARAATLKNNTLDGSTKAYKLVEGETEDDKEEQLSFEKAKSKAKVTDVDAKVASLAIDKIVNRRGHNYVTYHRFEQQYNSENVKPIRMFQKMFENPDLLKGIMELAGVDRDYSWSKQNEYGEGTRNWRIEIK